MVSGLEREARRQAAHGTAQGYMAWGCRNDCPATPTCREAQKAYMKDLAARKAAGIPVFRGRPRKVAAALVVETPVSKAKRPKQVVVQPENIIEVPKPKRVRTPKPVAVAVAVTVEETPMAEETPEVLTINDADFWHKMGEESGETEPTDAELQRLEAALA